MPTDPPRRGAWPRAAASAIIFRGDDVLIVERGKGAAPGLWSLPGGHIEPGEKARDAAAREVAEETGVEARIVGLLDVHDAIFHDANGDLRAHYVLSVFHGVWIRGIPAAASDSRDARFVPLAEIDSYRMTPGAQDFIRRAHAVRMSPA